jgi:hypothetical protein
MIELGGMRPVSRSFFSGEMLHEFPELKAMLTGKVRVAEGPGGFTGNPSSGL